MSENVIPAGNGHDPQLPILTPQAAPPPPPVAADRGGSPRLAFRLEEELPDQRSNRVAYRFVVENVGSSAVELMDIEAQAPEGATLQEVQDTSVIALDARRAELLRDLTQIVADIWIMESAEVQKRWIQTYAEVLKEVYSVRGLLRAYYEMARRGLKQHLQFLQQRFDGLRFKINDVSDAESAYVKWIRHRQEQDPVRRMYEAKLDQLQRVCGGGSRRAIATIEPGSYFARTFIFDFKRSSMEPLKYQVTVEAAYRHAASTSVHSSGASATLLVSPRPTVLSVWALVGSALGVIVNAITTESTDKRLPFMELLFTSPMQWRAYLLSAILALAFFQIFEHTKLAKSFESLRISWRTALVIGLLCGMANEQVVTAISAFID